MTNTLLARVLETANMDRTVRPQDDFYRHVNGTWLATHEIPADRPMDGAFHALRDASEKYARTIAQDAAAGRLDDPDAQRIAVLWTQFLDEDAIEAAGSAPLHADLEFIEACTSRNELAEAMGFLMRTGIGGLVGAYVGTDPHDSSAYMVSLVQSGIGLPDEAYYREEDYAPIRDAYIAHTARLLSLAGMPDPEGAARRIMALETAIASHHRDSVSNRDPLLSDNPTLWSELTRLAPGFDWDAWARGAHMPVSGLVVNVDQPDYLRGAASLWEHTDLATLKEWLRAPPCSRPTSSKRTSTSTAAPWRARKSCARVGSARCPSSSHTWARPWGAPGWPAISHPTRRKRWTRWWAASFTHTENRFAASTG